MIGTVFDPPLATDSREDFSTKAFALAADLNVWTGEVNDTATDVQTNADTTAALALAMAFPAFSGTSTSSLAVGVGSKSWQTQSGKGWVAGQLVVVSSGANSMKGVVSSYSGTTLVVDVASVSGSGTYAAWVIVLGYASLPVESVNGGQLAGFRNRVINGDMRIDQRFSGASTTAGGSGNCVVDRWSWSQSVAGKFTAGRNLGGATNAANGFPYVLGVQTGAAYTPLAGDYFSFIHNIEGLNVHDFCWGSSGAKAITVSFWIYSSIAGQVSCCARNWDGARSYPFLTPAISASTWTQVFVTIPGDTVGTLANWPTDNGKGLCLFVNQGLGTTYAGAANAWAAANYFGATGGIQTVGTLNATMFWTGVQVELGVTATVFERRPIGVELALCQRYYYRIGPSTTGTQRLGTGFTYSAVLATIDHKFPVEMRIKPGSPETTGVAANYGIDAAVGGGACSAVPVTGTATTKYSAEILLAMASGLTAGQGCAGFGATNTGYLGWSAEL